VGVPNLPFLKPKGIAKRRQYAGESRYGFSEDDELIENALDELISALERKDHRKVMESIQALIHCIKNREDSNATDSLEEAQSV
jgi:hypothetical protein